MQETPDIETSSADYARRFSGRAGAYFLSVQEAAVTDVLRGSLGKTILDVGGGHAQLAPFLSEAGYDVTVIGSADVCRKRLNDMPHGTKINYVTGNLLKLPFENQSYDLIVSVRLLSHIRAWRQLIEEFCRVAKSAVIIDYPSIVSMNALTPLLFRLKKGIEKNTRTYTSFSKRQLASEFEKHGFYVTNVRPQLFLPMVLHRMLDGAYSLQLVERIFAAMAVTRFFGSPVVLRADRQRNR